MQLRTCGLIILLICGSEILLAQDLHLVEAMKKRDGTTVRALVKKGADVNVAAPDGATPLHWAVHWDDLESADTLIRAGARVNATNEYGATPLYLACVNRNSPAVARLLQAGANPNAALLNGETALMTCARTGDAAAVKALIGAGANVNASEQRHHQTALMWAAAEKHPEVVRELLRGGANVRAQSRTYSQTVSSDLRTNRADLAFTVRRGASTALVFAAQVGDVESARLLVEAKADVNDALPDGTSALALAAYNNQTAVAEYLVEKGAEVNAAASGFTALHAAVLRSDLRLVNTLLSHGANPNARITKGTPLRRSSTDFNLPAALIGATPYLLAAKFLETDIMKALASAGADTGLPMKDGTTPLMAAAGIATRNNQTRRGRTVIDGGKPEGEDLVLPAVASALEQGGGVNTANLAGDTALHGAASMGYNGVVQFLVDHGASLNAKNNRGQTPLAQASAGGNAGDASGQVTHPGTVELLRKLGATQ